MAAGDCPKLVRSSYCRITRQDSCGTPLASNVPNSRMAFKGYISMQISPDLDNGTEVLERNAAGDICIFEPACPALKGLNLQLQLCTWNTYAVEMLAGAHLLTDAAGKVEGQWWRKDAGSCDDSLQMEFFVRNGDAAGCDAATGASNAWAVFVLPWTKNWQLSGNFSFQNGAILVTLSGYAVENANWSPAVPAEWPTDHTATIRNAGPFGWHFAADLPTVTSECAYLPAA